MTDEEFRSFYAETAAPLHAYVSRVAGDEDVAADVVQGAYIRFLRASSQVRDVRARRVYLFRIATNLLRDQFRHEAGLERRARQAAEELQLATDGETTGSDSARGAIGGISIETRLEVRRALFNASARDRELLWLAYVQGMTHREIASVAGIAEESVRVLLLRARRRLAKLLEERGIGPADT
jgi:RNA polymerase sigma-70 factor (ECF subfamily)